MKLRVIVLGLVAGSAAAAENASTTVPVIPTVEETGQVPLDCDKRLGAYQFAKQRYEAKVKLGTQTWEDVANYHSTRADWLECVANGQFEAIKAERHARNEVIAQLNTANSRARQLDEEIRAGGWYVVEAEARDAFTSEPETLWSTVLRRQRGNLAFVASFPDDPTMN